MGSRESLTISKPFAPLGFLFSAALREPQAEFLAKSQRDSMNQSLKLVFALALTLILFGTAPAQARRPIMPADILRIASLSEAEVSPDGEWVAYTVSSTDGNQTVSTLWLVRPGERFFRIPPTGRPPEQRRNPESPITPGRPLLPSGWNAANPRWSRSEEHTSELQSLAYLVCR